METDEEITNARLFELLTAELNRDAFGNSSPTPTDHTFAPTESSANGSVRSLCGHDAHQRANAI